MSNKLTFTNEHTQTTGSHALGHSSHLIEWADTANSNAPMFQYAQFGVSVSGASGVFGLNIMAMCPDGTTVVVGGATNIGGTKRVFGASNAGGTTQWSGVLRPYEVQYQRCTGASISYTASVWGILYNP